MTFLCELAQKYGTDKFPWYTPFYDLLFNYRRNDVKRVLEIGIGTETTMRHVPNYQPGASLRMWRDYFPNAAIMGLDIDRSVVDYLYYLKEERISVGYCDQSSSRDLLFVTKGLSFDLIVDDGSHDPDHQRLTFHTLSPYLKPGGVYVIEDVNGQLNLPETHQHVDCFVPHSDKVGRLVLC